MGKKTPRKYTAEFKRQAVNLANDLGVKKASRQLGISETNIHNWRTKQRVSEQPAIEVSMAEENRRLREENADLRKVNHILKAAAAFFSQDHLK